MKRLLALLTIGILLTSFILAAPKMTSRAVEQNRIEGQGIIEYVDVEGGCWRIVHDGENYEPVNLNSRFQQDGLEVEFKASLATNQVSVCQVGTLITLSEIKTEDENSEQNRERTLTQEQIQNIIRERNRLRIREQTDECPENCTCTGSVTRCQLQDNRQMTIQAGNSGNTIVQTQNTNASTFVELYKSEGKLYGKFEDTTKEIKMLPDQVKEKIRIKLMSELEDEEIELDEEGVYQIRARQRVKLFSLIQLRERVRARIDPETGEILRLRRAWWSFLATNAEPPIVGAGCGSVSPASRDECCQNKGFDYYDEELGECLFNN